MPQQIETLTTVWDARFDQLEQKLNNVIRANYGAAAKVEKAWGDLNAKLDRSFDGAFGGLDKMGPALGRVDGAARGAAAGAAVAATAVAALTLAISETRAAAAYAASLQDAAEKAHLSTDALQEYQYALEKAGGEGDRAADAINNFSEKLGKAQGGVRSAVNAFHSIGISKAQLDSFKSTEEGLTAVIRRIGELKNTAQQDAAIATFGLENLAPLIGKGADEMARLREEARAAGVVMDAELVRRGAEVDDQFKVIARVIDVQLKSALVDLGPVLVTLLGYLATFAKEAAAIADAFRDIENKSDAGLARVRARASDDATRLGLRQLAGQKLSANERDILARSNATIAEVDAQRAVRSSREPRIPTGSRNLEPPLRRSRGSGATQRDTTEERTAQVEAAMAQAVRDLLRAQLDLTLNVQDRAKIEKLIADEERKVALARIAKQQADIADDKGLSAAKKAELTAQLNVVKGKVEEAARQRAALIDRDAASRTAKEALDLRMTEMDGQAELLEIQLSMAKTAAERRDLELRLLDLADRRAEAELQAVLAAEDVSDAEKKIAQAKLVQLRNSRGAREGRVLNGTQGPLESYLSNLPASVDQVNERMQALAANGISDVIDGLAQAAAGTRDLGDVFRSVITQMALDLTRLNLQRALAGLMNQDGQGGGDGGAGGFLSGLFKSFKFGGNSAPASMPIPYAYASGTDFAQGGLSVVGEGGPEILNIPRGAQVIPNDILRSLAKQPAARGGDSFSPTLHLNLTLGPGVTARDARRTGAQVGGAALAHMAQARKRGY